MLQLKPKDIVRFHNKFTKDECYIWQDKPDKQGYGRFFIGGANKLAHYVAFVIKCGKEPIGYLKHACGNKLCVRPEHIVDLGVEE